MFYALFVSLRFKQFQLAFQIHIIQAALDDENAAKIVPKSTLDDNELLTQPQADGEQDAQSPPSTAE